MGTADFGASILVDQERRSLWASEELRPHLVGQWGILVSKACSTVKVVADVCGKRRHRRQQTDDNDGGAGDFRSFARIGGPRGCSRSERCEIVASVNKNRERACYA